MEVSLFDLALSNGLLFEISTLTINLNLFCTLFFCIHSVYIFWALSYQIANTTLKSISYCSYIQLDLFYKDYKFQLNFILLEILVKYAFYYFSLKISIQSCILWKKGWKMKHWTYIQFVNSLQCPHMKYFETYSQTTRFVIKITLISNVSVNDKW